jgi:hypothetical protein
MMLDLLTITVLLTLMSRMLLPQLVRRAPILLKATDGLPLRSRRVRTIILQRTR